MTAPTIAEVFDQHRRTNALNALRLVLASGVIIQHAHVVQVGAVFSGSAVNHLIGQFPVDGFFALSGFLIAKSWFEHPKVGDFLSARVARLFPGFIACLLVTAVVLAPVSTLVDGSSQWGSNLSYVLHNIGLVIFQNGIGGTLVDIPWPGDWNASLWTLKWEFALYVAILVTGVTGLLRRRSLLLVALAAIWCVNLAVCLHGGDPEVVADAGRLTLMFLCGTALYLFSDRVRLTGRAVLGCLAVVVIVGFAPFDYRLVAAPFLAYGALGLGILCTHPRLRLRNDISYGVYIYGFPVQQLLVVLGAGDLPLPVFCVVTLLVTCPIALISWKVVEQPVLRIVRRRRGGRRDDRPVLSAGSPHT